MFSTKTCENFQVCRSEIHEAQFKKILKSTTRRKSSNIWGVTPSAARDCRSEEQTAHHSWMFKAPRLEWAARSAKSRLKTLAWLLYACSNIQSRISAVSEW